MKILTIICIPLIRDKPIKMPLKPYFSQQPRNKGLKRVAILEPKEIKAYIKLEHSSTGTITPTQNICTCRYARKTI
jgi:hypothetical protein